MLNPTQFTEQVEAYLQASGMSPTGFGRAALGDPTFVFELRNGRQVSLSVAGRVLDYIAQHPPANDAAPGGAEATGGAPAGRDIAHVDKMADADAAVSAEPDAGASTLGEAA